MRSKYLVISTLIMLCFGVNAATPSSGIATHQPTEADYKAGEKWVWKYKGVTTGGEIRADGHDTKEIISQSGVLSMLTGAGTIPLANIVKPTESKTPRYSWPLHVGKKWKFEEHWTSEDGTTGATIQDAEVISYKEETVAAGTFMAYAIRYKGKITNSRGYSADTEDVHLYAPKLKTFINCKMTTCMLKS